MFGEFCFWVSSWVGVLLGWGMVGLGFGWVGVELNRVSAPAGGGGGGAGWESTVGLPAVEVLTRAEALTAVVDDSRSSSAGTPLQTDARPQDDTAAHGPARWCLGGSAQGCAARCRSAASARA